MPPKERHAEKYSNWEGCDFQSHVVRLSQTLGFSRWGHRTAERKQQSRGAATDNGLGLQVSRKNGSKSRREGTCSEDFIRSARLRPLEVHFTPEQESKLSEIASQAGTDAEQLVKNPALRLLDRDARFHCSVRKGMEQADRGDFVDEREMEFRIDRMLQS